MMLVFNKPCENFLLLLPPTKFFTATANSKPHLLHLHLHLHLHHHHVKLHCSPLKSHFKSTLSSSSPSDSSSSSSLTTTTTTTTTTTAAVDFLMNSGGLSYVQAIQVIRKVPSLLNNGGRKPRSVIAYFESIGFSKTIHISKAISICPRVLVSDVEKTLKPKIQLFKDFGFSDSDIADLIASKPSILRRSLENQIKPSLEIIKRFVKTNEYLIKAIKRNVHLLIRPSNYREFVEANIDVLQHQYGVPDSEILHLIVSRLQALLSTPKAFKTIVKRIVSLGFKPGTRRFVSAIAAMSGMSKDTWNSKVDLLKGGLGGWSDEQILDAFRRHPKILTLSGDKLKEGIEFFNESLNMDASFVSQNPLILGYSLKVRVMPRLAVLKCLMSKENINKQFVSLLKLTETEFLSKYVFEYQEQLPYLYEVYNKECMLGCEQDNNGEITNQQQQQQQDHADVDMTV